MISEKKQKQTFSELIVRPSRPAYCIAWCLTIRTHWSFDAQDKVEGVQDRLTRRFLSLLVDAIVTPLTAAADQRTILEHLANGRDKNLLVSHERADTVSIKQIYSIVKDAGSLSATVPITNRSLANQKTISGLERPPNT